MSKDFQEFLGNKANYNDFIPVVKSQDPNLFTNKQMSSVIGILSIIINQYKEMDMLKIYIANTVECMLFEMQNSLVIAPLTTIHVSLQQSVLPHINKFGDGGPQDKANSLVKTTKEITAHEKRKFELLIKSGVVGQNKPFRAPVYTSYFECVKALANQGVLGFFKGYFTGVLHYTTNSYIRFTLTNKLDYDQNRFWHKGNQMLRQLSIFFMTTSVDILTNPMMYIQSRFILQNRLPNFQLYKGIAQVFKKNVSRPFKEFFQGATTHIWKNLFITLFYIPAVYIQDERQNLLYCLSSSAFASYPWLTVIRRLHCQSKLPGMISVRYSGPWHAFRLILQEEGIKGLYRGFMSFALASSIMSYLLFFTQLERDEEML